MEVYCAALLFDMDGVLIDSTPAVARVWWQWSRERGFDPEKVVKMAHGRPSLSTIRDLLPDSDHEAENGEVERREMEDLKGVAALPGARELLAHLPPERYTIVTSSTRKLAEVRLRAAGLPLPKLLVTSSDIVNGKPHPEPYLKAAGKLRVEAGECVVVEDAPSGVRSGKAAGARVIGFTTTVNGSELREAGAEWILPNCESIVASSMPGGLRLTLYEEAVAGR